MPHLSKANRPPEYGFHKATGQARVCLGRRDLYLGEYGSEESLEAHQALIAEWQRMGKRDELVSVGGDRATVDELVAGCWQHSKGCYIKDGEPTHTQYKIKAVLKRLRRLYGSTPVLA